MNLNKIIGTIAAMLIELSLAMGQVPTLALDAGTDITEALQNAIDKQYATGNPIVLPSGTFEISETIRGPFRSGWSITGSGTGLDGDHPALTGKRTCIGWAGEDGGTMFELTGSNGRFGNLVLMSTRKRYVKEPKAKVGILFTYPEDQRGIGTGKVTWEPLAFHRFETGFQNGEEYGTRNCDEHHFEWVEGQECNTIYHGVNAQGMGIVFNHIRNYGNRYSLLFDGGGQVHVRSSLTTHPNSTLLKVNDSRGVGKHNGFFRLSQTKVDKQTGDSFTLIDSENDGTIRYLVDGGIQSNDSYAGTLAKLAGRNVLTVRDFSSTFHGIECKPDDKGNAPTVLLDGCTIWGEPDFSGLDLRTRSCRRYGGGWVDDFPAVETKVRGTFEGVIE